MLSRLRELTVALASTSRAASSMAAARSSMPGAPRSHRLAERSPCDAAAGSPACREPVRDSCAVQAPSCREQAASSASRAAVTGGEVMTGAHQVPPAGSVVKCALPGHLGNPRVHQMKCVSAAQLASTCSPPT